MDGPVTLRRVYGDAALCKAWSEAPGFRLIHSGSGKNAADLLMTVEAMEFAFDHPGAVIVLASSDRDFRHLSIRLCERGHRVIGLGERKTPAGFRAACSAFHELTPPGESLPLECKVRDEIARYSPQGKGMPIVRLATVMHRDHAVTISALPEKSWRSWLIARSPLFEIDPKGPEAHVRFRPEGFAALA